MSSTVDPPSTSVLSEGNVGSVVTDPSSPVTTPTKKTKLVKKTIVVKKVVRSSKKPSDSSSTPSKIPVLSSPVKAAVSSSSSSSSNTNNSNSSNGTKPTAAHSHSASVTSSKSPSPSLASREVVQFESSLRANESRLASVRAKLDDMEKDQAAEFKHEEHSGGKSNPTTPHTQHKHIAHNSTVSNTAVKAATKTTNGTNNGHSTLHATKVSSSTSSTPAAKRVVKTTNGSTSTSTSTSTSVASTPVKRTTLNTPSKTVVQTTPDSTTTTTSTTYIGEDGKKRTKKTIVTKKVVKKTTPSKAVPVTQTTIASPRAEQRTTLLSQTATQKQTQQQTQAQAQEQQTQAPAPQQTQAVPTVSTAQTDERTTAASTVETHSQEASTLPSNETAEMIDIAITPTSAALQHHQEEHHSSLPLESVVTSTSDSATPSEDTSLVQKSVVDQEETTKAATADADLDVDAVAADVATSVHETSQHSTEAADSIVVDAKTDVSATPALSADSVTGEQNASPLVPAQDTTTSSQSNIDAVSMETDQAVVPPAAVEKSDVMDSDAPPSVDVEKHELDTAATLVSLSPQSSGAVLSMSMEVDTAPSAVISTELTEDILQQEKAIRRQDLEIELTRQKERRAQLRVHERQRWESAFQVEEQDKWARWQRMEDRKKQLASEQKKKIEKQISSSPLPVNVTASATKAPTPAPVDAKTAAVGASNAANPTASGTGIKSPAKTEEPKASAASGAPANSSAAKPSTTTAAVAVGAAAVVAGAAAASSAAKPAASAPTATAAAAKAPVVAKAAPAATASATANKATPAKPAVGAAAAKPAPAAAPAAKPASTSSSSSTATSRQSSALYQDLLTLEKGVSCWKLPQSRWASPKKTTVYFDSWRTGKTNAVKEKDKLLTEAELLKQFRSGGCSIRWDSKKGSSDGETSANRVTLTSSLTWQTGQSGGLFSRHKASVTKLGNKNELKSMTIEGPNRNLDLVFEQQAHFDSWVRVLDIIAKRPNTL